MFDDRLKNTREQKGYTQQEIADAIGIPRVTYCSYERNQREPTAIIMKRIALFLNVSLDYLLGSELPTPPDEDTNKILSILPSLAQEEKRTVRLFCEFVKSQHKQKD